MNYGLPFLTHLFRKSLQLGLSTIWCSSGNLALDTWVTGIATEAQTGRITILPFRNLELQILPMRARLSLQQFSQARFQILASFLIVFSPGTRSSLIQTMYLVYFLAGRL